MDRILSAVATERELRPLLEKALQGALDLTGLEGGTLCLLDGESRTFRAAVEINVNPGVVPDSPSGTLKVGECLCGASAET